MITMDCSGGLLLEAAPYRACASRSAGSASIPAVIDRRNRRFLQPDTTDWNQQCCEGSDCSNCGEASSVKYGSSDCSDRRYPELRKCIAEGNVFATNLGNNDFRRQRVQRRLPG